MADLKDVEAVVDAIRFELETNLPAKLDAIDAEKADEITLEDVAHYHVCDASQTPAYPSVEIIAEPTALPAGSQKTGQEDDRIVLIATVANSEALNGESVEETLFRKVARTVRGIQEVLEDNPNLSSGGTAQVNWMRITEKDYSPTGIVPDTGLYVKAGALSVAVRRFTSD
jgi:hypothetical protein